MADTINSRYTLNVGIQNSKGKTETLKVPNPTSTVTESGIRNAVNYMITNGMLIDDNDEVISDTAAVLTAYTELVDTRNIDLT